MANSIRNKLCRKPRSPVKRGLRAWPQNSSEATATRGKADDFRIYNTALSQTDIEGIYGSGGDFHNRSIEFAYSQVQLPKFITIRFLEDGLQTELNASSFDLSDLSVSNGSNEFSKIEMGSGPLLCHRITTPPLRTSMKSPKDQLPLPFSVRFSRDQRTVSYNPQTPAITSSSTSHWEVGLGFAFKCDATALSVVAGRL